MVEFKVIDDFLASRNAWKSDEIDLLWTTVDAVTTEVNGLKEYEPQIIFQADWSRGGDAIVVTREIKAVADLKGLLKISSTFFSPSTRLLAFKHVSSLEKERSLRKKIQKKTKKQ